METLKPCPFCGSRNIIPIEHIYGIVGYTYGVTCYDCKAQISQRYGTPERAVKAWNTRKGRSTK